MTHNLAGLALQRQRDGDHPGAVQTLRVLAGAGRPAVAAGLAGEYAVARERAGDPGAAIGYLGCVADWADAGDAQVARFGVGELLAGGGAVPGALAAYQVAATGPDHEVSAAAEVRRHELLAGADHRRAGRHDPDGSPPHRPRPASGGGTRNARRLSSGAGQ